MNKKLITLIGISLFSLSLKASDLQSQMKLNIATENNLKDFELISPELSETELREAEIAARAEASGEADAIGEYILDTPKVFMTLGKSPNVTIEIFQNAKTVGKQFLVARQYGQIRYVFAISAGGHGRSTPGGEYGVSPNPGVSASGQKWRHMSLTYPGSGENNMDHLTYFRPKIGFHSTVFGLFSNLGKADSHGCVRLGRPQARRIFALIKNNASAATIYSYKSGEPAASDLPLIKKMLAKDLNFIQSLLRARSSGEAGMSESEYMNYINGRMDRSTLREILQRNGLRAVPEIPGDMELGPINPPRGWNIPSLGA